MKNKKTLELYFHIPFCRRKCLYCDFLSAPGSVETKRAYMEALRWETAQAAVELKRYLVSSVFIGGGTPSVVPPEEIGKLLQEVRTDYHLDPEAEITIEVNPGNVDYEKLRSYREAGINRLSIGLQSANDKMLETIGRIHTWQQFLDTYLTAVTVGFTNINVDVMTGLPGQSREDCENTLKKVLNLDPKPKHISAYSLILEEGTELKRLCERGDLVLPDEDEDRLMYELTGKLLSDAGYHRYEISNYALEGYECRHNTGYWKRVDYRGFGIGAASLLDNVRFRNGDELSQYLRDPGSMREETHQLSKQEQMEEFMFLGLRLTEGVCCEEFAAVFGVPIESVYSQAIEKSVNEKLLIRRSVGNRTYFALTERGLDVSNYCMARFLLE